MPSSKTVAISGAVAAALIGGSLALLPTQDPCEKGHTVCLSWAASPGWDSGAKFATSEKVWYDLFRVVGGAQPSPNPTTPIASTQTLALTLTNETVGKNCYVLQTRVVKPAPAVNVSSVSTGQACKMVRLDAPTDGAIEAPTDGSIEPK